MAFLLQSCSVWGPHFAQAGIKGWYKAQQTGAPAREECNKYDLTAAPYF
jgi:hypothetical protein